MSKKKLCARCRNPLLKPRIDLSSAEQIDAARLEPSVKEVEALLSLAEQDSKDYKAELVRLRSQITHIEAQQVRLENYRRQLQFLISALRRLPNETLAHIFDYACKENLLQEFPWHDDDESSPPTRLTSPVITYLPTIAISSVCSRWRGLALSYPSLWSNLKVEICMTSEQSNGFIAILDRYLEVSGNAPLNLDLNIQGASEQENIEPPHRALVHLTHHVHRWKRFKYMGEDSLTSYGIHLEHKYPILTDLDLEAEYGSLADLDCFKHAHNLRALTINASASLDFPYHRLQWANFEISSHEDVENILEKCSSLTTLQLTNQYSSLPISAFPRSPSSGHNILSLHIHENTQESFSNLLFSCFNFPLLRDLTISRDVNEGILQTWRRKSFESFISRSACTITTFTIHNLSLSDEELIAALRIMPSLTELDISDKRISSDRVSPITSGLISSLRCKAPKNRPTKSIMHLVPRLRSLRLVFNGMVFDDKAFIKTVQSRWLPDSESAMIVGADCLRSVVLKFCRRKVDVEVYRPLQDLDKKGLRVVVSGTKKRTKI